MAIREVLLNHDWDGYVCVKMSALADLLSELPGHTPASFPLALHQKIESLFDERGDAILLRGTGRQCWEEGKPLTHRCGICGKTKTRVT